MLTKLKAPKFQIGDRVRLSAQNSKGYFTISGITKGVGDLYFYCQDAIDAGWVAEGMLEWYIPDEMRPYVEQAERTLHGIEEAAQALGELALKLDDEFDSVPRHLQEEMDRVAKLVSRRFRS